MRPGAGDVGAATVMRPCRHKVWEVQAVNTEDVPYKTPGLLGHDSVAVKTFVLWKCTGCGKSEAETFGGRFTINDFQGTRP